MWTHGFNIFSPSENIAYHLYLPKVFLENGIDWVCQQKESQQRAQYGVGAA